MEPTRYFVNNNDVQSYSLKELLEHLEPGMLIRRYNSESWEKWEDVRSIKYLSSLSPLNRNWFVVLAKLFLGIVIYFCVTLEIYPASIASYYDHFGWFTVILHLVLPITASQIFPPLLVLFSDQQPRVREISRFTKRAEKPAFSSVSPLSFLCPGLDSNQHILANAAT